MTLISVEASSIQGRLQCSDADGNAISATVPFLINIYDTQIRVVIDGKADVLIERGTGKTRFIVHPHEGDPIAMVVTPDDAVGKPCLVHLSQDADSYKLKKDL